MEQILAKGALELTVLEIERHLAAAKAGADVAFTMISDSFDIVMANRVQERLIAKRGVGLVGKKCYREFEKREDICPNCPGVAALASGKPHKAERVGVPDEGAPYRLVSTAYPVFGPSGKPIGFVEIIEKALELEQLENVMVVVATLQAKLSESCTVNWVLRHALDAALSLEGIDMGCAYVAHWPSGQWEMLSNRGFPRAYVDGTFGNQSAPGSHKGQRSSLPQPWHAPGPNDDSWKGSAVIVPVLHNRQPTGKLLVGMSRTQVFPMPAMVALTSVGALASLAISRLIPLNAPGS